MKTVKTVETVGRMDRAERVTTAKTMKSARTTNRDYAYPTHMTTPPDRPYLAAGNTG